MRARLIAALAAAAPGLEVHDLTGINAARPGAGWGAELDIAVLATARVPNAYVRIEPGAVRVGGLVRDGDHRQAVSMELMALTGGTVRLTLQLREPLIVVAPFVFAVVKDASGGLRLETCAARGAEEQTQLEVALNRPGIAPGEVRCPVALGGPRGDWAGAVTAGLAALDLLPAGRFRLTYHSAELEAMAPAGAVEMVTARAALAVALPEGYALLDRPGAGDGGADPAQRAGRYWIRFSRGPGQLVLSGVVPDETARQVIETYAAARFGQAALHPALGLSGVSVPAGWEAAALVALDALSGLSEGEAELSPGRIAVSGTVAGPAEAGRLHRMMAGAAPEGYEVASALSIDLPAQVAAMPLTTPRCAVVLSAAVEGLPIAFAPGSAVFETGSREALDRLGDIFRSCAPGRIEIGGHTDSQGSTGLNQRLSRARAEAVLDALMVRGVALDRLAARGYGEEQPVASNETEIGRARNRRIEFTALD
jgi:OOP family OmpA-OmpF porin